MKKGIISNACLAVIAWLIALYISRDYHNEGLAILIGFGGLAIASFNILRVLTGGFLTSSFYIKRKKYFAKRQAETEILRCKNLFDAGVLTREEFEDKANDLKAVILEK